MGQGEDRSHVRVGYAARAGSTEEGHLGFRPILILSALVRALGRDCFSSDSVA
jgi:hypothetical protein